MITYTIHEEPAPRADRIDRGERLVFVKDGFSILAAYFGPLWLLVHRLWLPLLAYLLAVGLIVLAVAGLGLKPGWITLLVLGLHLVIGFEADSLKRYGLDRRHWTEIGTVTGRNTAECERRFFEYWLPGEPLIATAGRELSARPSPAPPPAMSGAATAAPAVASNPPPRRSIWPFGRRN